MTLRGSLLFEQICQLPEYYLTRTETEILESSAQAIAQITGNCQIVELGSGSATKTRILLSAYTAFSQRISQYFMCRLILVRAF
jgi:L-histidine N-alpha-methyltransferase